jgi:alcohol dehydrogenase
MAAHDYGEMLAQVESGRLRPDRLVSARIGLDEAGEALAAMGHPASAAGVTVIVP